MKTEATSALTGSSTTSSDERVMAAIGHFFGMIAALIIWATQKDKSRFVKFQALQALAFDGVVMVVSMALMLCMFTVMIGGMVWSTAVFSQAPNDPEAMFPLVLSGFLPMFMFACFTPLALAAMLGRLIAAVSVASGRNFRYPLLGSRVESFLALDD